MTKRTILKPYKTYMFRNKDPIIDKVRTAVEDSGTSHRKISQDSGVSTSAMNGWFYGATRRPQFATVNAVLRSIGYDLKITRRND